MTNEELETARAAYVESLVARTNEDDEMDVDCFISLDEDMFKAKMKAALPHIRVESE
jgi:hypothetical protein